MNLRETVFTCIVLSCLMGRATAQTTQPLKVGDTVPDLMLEGMVNYPSSTARLSDFKGKNILIDFWATWCVPCIRSFPKLEKMQAKHKEDLAIVLVSFEEKKIINAVYTRRERLTLPSAATEKNKQLRKYFPHREIPHVVWIGKDRKIYAITDGEHVTDEAVAKWLTGGKSGLPVKDEGAVLNSAGIMVDSIEKDGPIRRISVDSNILYQSMFRKYDPRLTTYVGFTYRKLNFFVDIINASAADLAMIGYGFLDNPFRRRVVYEISDPTLMSPGAAGNLDEWRKQYSVSYRLIMNKPDSMLRYRIMQRDVETVFGLWAYKKTIPYPSVVLKKVGDVSGITAPNAGKPEYNASPYHLLIVNEPISKLITMLNGYLEPDPNLLLPGQRRMPIIDETGITQPVSFYLKNIENIRDIDILNKSLRTIGLEISIEKPVTEVLFITDKPRDK